MKNKTKLPIYPEFKEVGIEDKEIIDSYNSSVHVVDDFLFTTLLTWSRLRSENSYSILNGNLVVKGMLDLHIDQLAFSIQGDSKIPETVEILIIEHGRLYLVPEKVVNLLPKDKFKITELPQYHDYIFDLSLISEMKGKIFYRRRRDLRKAESLLNGSKVVKLDLESASVQHDMSQLYERWSQNKDIDNEELKHEEVAFKRFLKYQDLVPNVSLGCYKDGLLVGFQINEMVRGSKIAYAHFNKSDLSVPGVATLLMKESAKELLKHNYKYLNHGCDVGEPGLREYKKSLRPVFQIKKYNISSK